MKQRTNFMISHSISHGAFIGTYIGEIDYATLNLIAAYAPPSFLQDIPVKQCLLSWRSFATLANEFGSSSRTFEAPSSSYPYLTMHTVQWGPVTIMGSSIVTRDDTLVLVDDVRRLEVDLEMQKILESDL